MSKDNGRAWKLSERLLIDLEGAVLWTLGRAHGGGFIRGIPSIHGLAGNFQFAGHLGATFLLGQNGLNRLHVKFSIIMIGHRIHLN